MNPRSQDQGVARGAIVLHRAARPVHLIEPAGEVEHGGPRPVVPAGEAHRVPPDVPGWVAHPLEIPWSDALELRQLEHRPEPPRGGSLARPRRLGGGVGRGSGDAEPTPEVRRDVEPGPVEPGTVPHAARGPEVLRGRVGHRRHHGVERRRALDRREPLHRAGVAQPEGAHAPVGPGLARGPLDGVVAVAALLKVRVEGAGGLVPPTDILKHHGVSPAHRSLHQRRARWELVPPIRRPMHQHRVSPVGRWAKDVGPKGDAVSHGDGNTGVDPERGLGAKRQRAEACDGEEDEEDGMPEHESNATRFGGKPLRAALRDEPGRVGQPARLVGRRPRPGGNRAGLRQRTSQRAESRAVAAPRGSSGW